MFAQGAKNIKINEVLTNNTASLQDEFGQHLPWVEIPNGDSRTQMSGRNHLILFLHSNPAKGAMHFATKAVAGQPLWFALYDGNGIDLIDSVSVPVLAEDKSYARIKDGELKWDIKPAEAVTPGIGNYIEINETKIARLKRDDPHGFGITVLSMGIVFSCLALLFVFFSILGKIMVNKEKADKASREAGWVKLKTARMPIEAKDSKIPPSKKKEDIDVYIAVIAMALKDYQDNLHDEESGIITIRPRHTMWNNEL